MKKKWIFIPAVCILLLSGCGQKAGKDTQKPEVITEEEERDKMDDTVKEVAEAQSGDISEEKKFMMETFGFTEEDLEGVDLIRFIEDYELREREWEAETVRQILESQRYMYVDDGTTAIYSIFSKSGGTLEEGDIITKFAIEADRGNKEERTVMDLASGKYYSGDATARSLSDEQIQKIKELVEKYGVSEWKQNFSEEEPDADSTYSFSWLFVIETEDGKYCAYNGYCSKPDSIPDHVDETIDRVDEILSE